MNGIECAVISPNLSLVLLNETIMGLFPLCNVFDHGLGLPRDGHQTFYPRTSNDAKRDRVPDDGRDCD